MFAAATSLYARPNLSQNCVTCRLGYRLSMYVSLLLRLARIYAHSTTSTDSLTPRPVPRLKADSIHALDQPILQFAPRLHPQFP